MRNKRLLGVALLAGVLVAGGTAFTAGNTMPASSTAGYGSTTATGVTVSDIHYDFNATDASKLTDIVFTTTTDVTGQNVAVTLYSAGTAVAEHSTTGVGAASSPCSTSGDGMILPFTLTCTMTDSIASFDEVGLTVTQ